MFELYRSVATFNLKIRSYNFNLYTSIYGNAYIKLGRCILHILELKNWIDYILAHKSNYVKLTKQRVDLDKSVLTS